MEGVARSADLLENNASIFDNNKQENFFDYLLSFSRILDNIGFLDYIKNDPVFLKETASLILSSLLPLIPGLLLRLQNWHLR
jgi:hypothetical protein